MAKDVLAQARVFLDKLNKNQKWILGGIATVVVGGIIAIIVAVSQPAETTTLFKDLEASDAAKITEYLKANKIDYQLIDNATTIVVPKERADEIRMSVANQGLIQDSYVGYELFDKTNLGMSEFVQQLNARRALEGELQRTIKSMDEIKDVKVHLVIPKKAVFKQDEMLPSAAVKLRFKSSRGLERIKIEGIQNIVASSVEGLTPDKVVVTDNNGRILSQSQADENSVAGITSTQYEQQRKLENYLTEKVQSILDPAYGRENSKVRLNTEIDFDQLKVNKTDYDPERQVERSEQTISDNLTNTDTTFVPTINEQQERLNEIKNYEISKADSHFVKGIGSVKRMTVTAIINENVEIKTLPNGLDTVVSTPRSEEELKGIKEAIKTVVGFNEERGDQVNVICVPFVELIADKVTEINENNHLNTVKWYEKEDIQKLLLLLLIILITAFVMFRIIHAKFAKEKMRIAMGLPAKLEAPKLDKFDSSLLALPKDEDEIDEEIEDSEIDEELYSTEEFVVKEIMDDFDDEVEIDEEEMDMMLDEFPDQLLLEEGLFGDIDIMSGEFDDMEEPKERISDAALLERAKAAVGMEQSAIMESSEDELMKLELQERVNAFITEAPDVALKLIRVLYNQEK